MKEDSTKKQNTQPLRDSAKIMVDWIDPIRELPADDFRDIVLGIVDYECYGKSPELSKGSPQTKMAWSFIYPQIKRMNEHYAEIAAKNRVNGNKGGRPPKANNERDEADSSKEEPPNPNGFSDNPKNPNGFSNNPKNPIRKEKIREDNNKENKSQEKSREGKASAPQEEGAYSPSSLMNILDFISPSLSSSFSRWIQYLNQKDRKLMPKTYEAYKAQYDRLANLSKRNPDIAKLIVDTSIERDWANLYPLRKPPFSLSSLDIGHVDENYEPPRNEKGEIEF